MNSAAPELEEEKARLREQAFRQRAQVPQADRPGAAKAAADAFFNAVDLEPGQVVAAYWPIRDEIDSKPLLTRLMDSGQPVCLPVVTGDESALEMRLWEQGQPLYEAGFGTLAPLESAPLAVPNIVIIPLLAFDKTGTRLGYGKGYYDRTLAAMEDKPLVVGYAFAAQELDFIPRESHDVPLDLLITENGVTRFPAS